MAHPYWPLFDLRVRTPRLQLRVPTEADVLALADLASRGIHDPETMPFENPWTDRPSPELERGVLQWNWRQLGTWEADDWHLGLAVVEQATDQVVGVQDVFAQQFRTLRSVITGSWLGKAHQGQGMGREMRAAVLHLAFDGLGAERAVSAAWHDNEASMKVSRSLGYLENGDQWGVRRGVRTRMIAFALDRENSQRRDDIEIEGLEPCLPMFGLGTRVVGVDGCRAGWVVAELAGDGSSRVDVVTSFDEVVERVESGDLAAAAVDVPIGLERDRYRACDLQARAELGAKRSSVFHAPLRATLDAGDHAAATALERGAPSGRQGPEHPGMGDRSQDPGGRRPARSRAPGQDRRGPPGGRPRATRRRTHHREEVRAGGAGTPHPDSVEPRRRRGRAGAEPAARLCSG